jgi:pimeloyl-ACP methyl ester carboxylesterase
MKVRSFALDVLAALACLAASWSCGGTESSSDGTRKGGSTRIDSAASATRKDDAKEGECSPIGVKRKDYFLHVVSTLPRSFGERAKLDIHRVSPVYEHGWCTHPDGGAAHAVILVHGAATEAVTTFDLQYPHAPDVLHPETDEERGRNGDGHEYSLMESLARAGVETFAVNQLGYGFSTRFQLDDPCNASQGDQLKFLVPNPLEQVCDRPPDPFRFTNTDAARDQLAVVVNHVLEEVDVEKVSFFSWSRGGNGVGAYTSRDPSKVESLIFLASEFETAGNPQQLPLLVADRAQSFLNWDQQLAKDPAGNPRNLALCPGEREPAILDAIWTSGRMRDPLGSTWGSTDELTGGVRRAPTATLSGWDAAAASEVHVPTLILTGKFDNQNPTPKQQKIYDNLQSSSKVLIKIDCATHFALFEGSTLSKDWKGPHATIHDAAVQWITSGTYQAANKGTFTVSSVGRITGPF